MNTKSVLGNNQSIIPVRQLEDNNEKVFFAYRTMEEIWERSNGATDEPHRHDYYTILWARNACGYHNVDFKEYIIEPNTIFFVSPGQVHNVELFSPPTGSVILFTCEFLQRNFINEDFITNLGLFSDLSTTPPIKINRDGKIKIEAILKEIEDTIRVESPFKFDKIGALMKLFLLECNDFAIQNPVLNTQSVQSGQTIVKEFKSLLEENFNYWHKVNLYADKMNITPDYLNDVVKNTTGKNAKEFIQNRIILEAKRLGLHTELSSKEIAYQIGFDDPSHFSKFFKNQEGKSFSEFREAIFK